MKYLVTGSVTVYTPVETTFSATVDADSWSDAASKATALVEKGGFSDAVVLDDDLEDEDALYKNVDVDSISKTEAVDDEESVEDMAEEISSNVSPTAAPLIDQDPLGFPVATVTPTAEGYRPVKPYIV